MTNPPYGSDPAGDNGTPPPSYRETSPGSYPPPGQYPPGYPSAGSYPPPGQYPPPSPGAFPPPVDPYLYPPPGAYYDASAPYGRHPVTGEALSDKSKLVGGLLQLLGLIGLLGFGRIYVGQTGLGIAQLLIGIIVSAVTCGFGIFVPIIWGIVDAVLFFTGSVRDAHGRPLRDGG